MTTRAVGAGVEAIPAVSPDPTQDEPRRTLRTGAGYALLALLAWVPPLLTDPGKVVADTKSYLYLDPSRLLSRAVSMWDPNVGMGTVTHQNIGYLFPMGPYYWVFDKLGVPDWVAQRLWLGALIFGAATGVLYLARTLALRGPGVVVAALFYAFSPYSLHYATRISVILLPWAGLGWVIGFTIKALRDGGWRYPALFAIWVQVVGSVNATALIFAGVAPVLWILYATFVTREVDWRRALGTALKIGLLSALMSAWWIAGLSLQGAYGLDVLKFSETVKTVATTSLPGEVLRGLGYWFFYGRDRVAPWNDATHLFTQRPAMILLSYGIVCLAFLGAVIVRWKHRAFFVLLVLVGVVIAVGAHPYDDPTPLGAVFKSFANSSSAGLALRSTARAIPLVALGLAMLLGSAINAAYAAFTRLRRPYLGIGAGVVIGALVLVNLPALYDGTYYTNSLERPENLPQYWLNATKYLDQQSHSTRVLELPGSDFASYRWGSTVDPITPGLIDRPYLARELVPYGTPASANLIEAFDRRIQEGLDDPSGYADLLRRMSIGDVLLRYDLQWERYTLVRPKQLQRDFTPAPSGLTKGPTFGSKPQGTAPREFIDEVDLGSPPNEKSPPALQDYKVTGPTNIVHAASANRAVVLAGDGEGLVDASDIGLLQGTGAVLYAASFDKDPAALRRALGSDGVVVVTDSNRKRAQRWSKLSDNYGYTEQANEKPYGDQTGDARLEMFPGQSEDGFTTTEQRGVKTVQASAYGNPLWYTPEDRAANAVDGDVTTAWRTQQDNNPIGQRLHIVTTGPITTDHVNLVQPQIGNLNRWITEVRLSFDGKQSIVVPLADASRSPAGQTISFGRRRFSTLDIQITKVNTGNLVLNGGLAGVGFAEVRLRDQHASHDIRIDEVIAMPRDALSALGARSASHPLVFVMSRERTLLVPPRLDPETHLAREFVLPTGRTFALTGTARLTSGANEAKLDGAVGLPAATAGGTAVSSSAYLPGCVNCRASAAIDNNPATAWNTIYGNIRGQWAEFNLPRRTTIDHMNLRIVADGRHSVPTKLRIDVDNQHRDVVVPPVKDIKGDENATVTVPITFPAMTGRRLRVTITDIREELAYNFSPIGIAMAAGIAELGIPGVQLAPLATSMPNTCRSDLLTVDGKPFPVRITGSMATATASGPLTIVPCDPARPNAQPALRLAPGPHVLRSATGADTGIQIDRLVLASDAGGAPLATSGGRVTGLPDRAPAAPKVTVTRNGRTKLHVQIRGAADPFWLVLGESQSPGWKATVRGGRSLGSAQLVDGFAIGWRITPTAGNVMDVTLEWTPQRRVWASLAISTLVAVLALGIVVVSYGRRRARARVAPDESDGAVDLVWPSTPLGARTPRWAYVAGPVVGGAVAGVVVSPVVGVAVGLLIGLALWIPRARIVLTFAPATLLGLAALYIAAKQAHSHFPQVFEWPTLFPRANTLAWLAMVLLAADAFVELIRTPRRRAPANGARDP
jgi:arabinofuranan 3-O-arabinosyltransferase